MDEKSTEKEIAERNTMQSEETDSDEALSASESAVITTESTNEDSEKDNKLATSQIQSDTSGIVSGSTSTSETSCKKTKSVGAQEKRSETLLHYEPTETGLLTSPMEIPCEEGSVFVANERTEPPVEPSIPSVAEIQIEESSSTDAVLSPLPTETDHTAASEMVSLSRTSDAPCEQEVSCTEKNKAASTERSSKEKKGTIVKYLRNVSPTKYMKAKKSRSKSMSPPKKKKPHTEEKSNFAPEAPIASKGKDKVSNKKEKGLLKRIKKSISLINVFSKKKPTESESLVAGEETEETEEHSMCKTEASTEVKQTTTNEIRWTPYRTSIAENVSLGGTTMTDVPSTSSSLEVVSAESSRKQSAAGENECEAVASVSSGSAEVQDSNINENNTKNESQKNDLSNEDGQESDDSDNIDQQQERKFHK